MDETCEKGNFTYERERGEADEVAATEEREKYD